MFLINQYQKFENLEKIFENYPGRRRRRHHQRGRGLRWWFQPERGFSRERVAFLSIRNLKIFLS